MPFPPREAQTRVKHSILTEYIGAWAGIISTGLMGQQRRRLRKVQPDFVFLDGYAGCGRYEGDVDDLDADPVWGSPILGVSALMAAASEWRRKGLDSTVSAVCVEDEEKYHSELIDNLRKADIGLPVVTSSGYSSRSLGSLAVLYGDFREHAQEILNALPETAFLLAFIDPYGPSARIEAVGPILRRPKTDAIILFPSHDVWLRGNSANKPENELTSRERGNLARNDALFGDGAWRKIAAKGLEKRDAVEEYVSVYEQRLRQLRLDLSIKKIGLQFSKVDTEGYHLILVTDNPDGAMRMNDILRKANVRRHVARWLDMEARIEARKEEQGVLELFDLPNTRPPEEEQVEPPLEEVVAAVWEALPQPPSRLTWKELKSRLADTLYLEQEVRKALTTLKGDVVDYSRLSSNGAVIEVKESPERPPA